VGVQACDACGDPSREQAVGWAKRGARAHRGRASRSDGGLRSAPPTPHTALMPTMLRALVILLVCLLLVPYALTPLYLLVRPVSTPMLWRWARGERVERIWTGIDAMSPALPPTVLVAEDDRFCQHAGVDWLGVQTAIEDAEDGDIRGASGIP